MAKKNKDESEDKVTTSLEQIQAFLKANKEDHYNFEEARNYKISTGSLILDLETGGGLTPGVDRFTGISEGGKTSCALSVARQFQLKHGDKGMVIYIKSEGRLSDEILLRAGVDTSPDKWFVFESNVYEAAIDLMRDLVGNNPTKKFYLFVIDCIDALIPKNDKAKATSEATKVAGGAVLGTDFLRRMSLAMVKRGHMVIMMSQRRERPKIDPYAKVEAKLTNGSGGNALEHYANWIFEFQPRFKDDFFMASKEKDARAIGHYAKIIFRKSTNERTGLLVRYPIKYGRIGGKSIWVEREIADLLLAFDKLKANGAWINVDESLRKEVLDSGYEIPEKFNGQNKFLDFLEENEKTTAFLFNKVYETVTGENAVLSDKIEEPEEEDEAKETEF
jgi:RecA/RadA recombinase